MKIIETNVQQLLTGLAVVPRRAADQLRRWQNDRKVYPGSTKMGAARLHNNYVSWYAETFGDKNSALSLTVWGLAMKAVQMGQRREGHSLLRQPQVHRENGSRYRWIIRSPQCRLTRHPTPIRPSPYSPHLTSILEASRGLRIDMLIIGGISPKPTQIRCGIAQNRCASVRDCIKVLVPNRPPEVIVGGDTPV